MHRRSSSGSVDDEAPAPAQRKLVWFVRHAEALHNVSKDSSQRDPGLTDNGRAQAQALATSGSLDVGPDLIVSSPLKRTLETAVLALPRDAHPDVRRVATPLAQEIGTSNADTGRPRADIAADFGAEFDLSEVEDMWYVKPAPWCKTRRITLDPGQQALRERKVHLAHWLQAQRATRIVLVTHHGFICHLLGVELANCEVAAVELTRAGEWVERKVRGVQRMPIVGGDGKPVVHKGSRPLRAQASTILKHYGASALAASEQAAGTESAISASRRRIMLALQAAAVAALLTTAVWRVLPLLRSK
mmetsp:Transcript_19170/g.47097  ORF Transcript_19170/g.47097 Transcript_19170/m.47097 type:complete len:303 (-) Transcript_19170:544-1452(-)